MANGFYGVPGQKVCEPLVYMTNGEEVESLRQQSDTHKESQNTGALWSVSGDAGKAWGEATLTSFEMMQICKVAHFSPHADPPIQTVPTVMAASATWL